MADNDVKPEEEIKDEQIVGEEDGNDEVCGSIPAERIQC
jgi:hypothetical protein